MWAGSAVSQWLYVPYAGSFIPGRAKLAGESKRSTHSEQHSDAEPGCPGVCPSRIASGREAPSSHPFDCVPPIKEKSTHCDRTKDLSGGGRTVSMTPMDKFQAGAATVENVLAVVASLQPSPFKGTGCFRVGQWPMPFLIGDLHRIKTGIGDLKRGESHSFKTKGEDDPRICSDDLPLKQCSYSVGGRVTFKRIR
jgi:hypothetical protein